MAFTGKTTFGGGAALPELAEDVADIIGIVSPFETPLLDHLGDPKRAATSTVHEWVEDELLPNTDKINQTSFSPNPTTATSITVDNGNRFQVGDLVRPADGPEVILVGGVSGNTLAVLRGYGGTTPTSLANNMQLTILGTAQFEGAEAAAARFTSRTRKQNYTQIFSSTVEVSGSMQAARAVGLEDELDFQKQERMRELLRDLENTVINGVAPSTSQQGSSSVRRTLNGIVPSISSNQFQPGADGIPDGDGTESDELNEAVLNAALRRIWDQSSGNVDTIVVGGAQKRRINAFATDGRAYLPEDDAYRNVISVYESDYGICRVVLSRWMPSDSVLLLDSSRVEVVPLSGRSFHYKPLAAVGDSARGQVIGEYTLQFMNEAAHGLINGLGT